MHNNFLDNLEKTNIISNNQNFQPSSVASKKRNKSINKSYNNESNLDRSENHIKNYTNVNTNMASITNKSVILDQSNFNSNTNSMIKTNNLDNSFHHGLPSAKM